MSDFLDRYGDQLRAAQASLDPVPSPPAPVRPKRAFGRGPRRGLLIGFATLAVAGPALAITQPWNPTLGRPGVDAPVSTDPAPASDAARDALGVLRRDQTAQDRERTAPLLKGIVGDQIAGVQTASIRSLQDGWALVPAQRVQTGPDTVKHDQLCFTNGTEITCGSATSVRTTGIGGSTASASENATTFTGLVPDGVASVRFTPKSGSPVEVAARSNFYELSVAALAPERTIDAPPGSTGPSKIPAPPMPVSGTLQWLDSSGNVIGPRTVN